MKYFHNKAKGFTLIEFLVGTTIFTFVIMIASASLVSILSASRKLQAQNIVIGNLDITLENISRSLRTGTIYHCGNVGNITTARSCESSSSNFIAFTAANGVRTAFRRDTAEGRIQKSVNCISSGCTNWVNITAPEIDIESLVFYVYDTSSSDNDQPWVFINIKGTAGTKQTERSSFNIQTTITQRLLDS